MHMIILLSTRYRLIFNPHAALKQVIFTSETTTSPYVSTVSIIFQNLASFAIIFLVTNEQPVYSDISDWQENQTNAEESTLQFASLMIEENQPVSLTFCLSDCNRFSDITRSDARYK